MLVWGGAGGLGTQAIQLVAPRGRDPGRGRLRAPRRASSASRSAPRATSTAREFDHWGIPPHWTDDDGPEAVDGVGARVRQARSGTSSASDATRRSSSSTRARRRSRRAIFVCDGGGMVVICAGTTGYSAMVDLRYHWVRQKRLQGSHGTNDEQARAWGELLYDGVIDPVRRRACCAFEEIGRAHQDMADGVHAQRQHRDPRRVPARPARAVAPEHPRRRGDEHRSRSAGLRGCAPRRGGARWSPTAQRAPSGGPHWGTAGPRWR